MARKEYDWLKGAQLKDHTKKKHAVLSAYFRQYLITRCQLPQQERFRVAIVDGFAGGGLYKCGSYGSPLIFIEVLIKTTTEINTIRQTKGMRPIEIECLLIVNDMDKNVVNLLKKNIAPLMVEANTETQHLKIDLEPYAMSFEDLYPSVKKRVKSAKCSNVFFNLDQCGYSKVTAPVINDIMNSWRSAEVLLTFAIQTMLTFLSPSSENASVPLEPEVRRKVAALLKDAEELPGKKEWLGEAEQIAYGFLRDCAPYVSPFSINNPDGWRYWLMHFANSYRARQVYNDILHQDSAVQAHFGKAGLHMLSYNPKDEGQLYLFDGDSRQAAKEALYDEIPRLISESGDVLSMREFYERAYGETPAHSDDIHEMIMANPDMEVVTEAGGNRRKANTIHVNDVLKLKSQTSLLFGFKPSNPK